MKRSIFTLIIALLFSATSFAQLTGTKSIPGDYPSVQAAIAALNASGVGPGGVTFNLGLAYTETFTSPTAGHITTVTGSATSPIVFQKFPLGPNAVITSAAGTLLTMDAIISIAGSDYVTFDGINLVDNPANTTAISHMEWGYAILKASATDGSQNITIKNSVITLDKTHTSSVGIYSNNHTTSVNTQLVVTAASGSNSNLKISGNTIDAYMGIYLLGYNHTSAPYAFYDQNNEIGKDGANFITNVGGGVVEAYGIYTKYQNNLKVANNTVTSTTAGSKTIYGIYLTTASNASYDLYGNTVTITFNPTDLYGNNYFNGIYCDMGGSGTNNASNIYNNSVTNCNFINSAGSALTRGIYLLNMGVTANVYGNSVTNNTIGGDPAATAIGEIRYFWIQQASTTKGPLTVHDNTVSGNSRIQSVPMANGSTYLLTIAGGGTTLAAYNNVISNNILTSSGSLRGLNISYASTISKDVYNNTISNISEANGSFNAITNSGGNITRVYQNKVQNISASPAATSANLTGIYQGTGTTAAYYYNNMISEINCPGSIATLGLDYNSLNGFFVESSANFKGFYNNTVYLNGTTAAANFGSSAFCAMSLTGVELRNNIFVNNSNSAGLGVTAALRSRNPSVTSYVNYTSNYNALYAGTPDPAKVLFSIGSAGTYTNAQTLVELRGLTNQDLQSVTELPPFVNIAASPYNLHLQNNVATQCEAGGVVVSTPIAITADYDGDARFPNSGYPVNVSFTPNAPDLGADEFGGLPNDVTAPSITYTPFTQTSSFAPRTLTATITDGSGVPTAGAGLPVLYWKLNTGSWQAAQGVWVSGSTYTFTFGAANAYHDLVSYYIVAQDMATVPNAGAMPWQGASGFTTTPPACSTPPATPSSYLVIQDISGTFHIGVGKDYTTLTAAANDLNDKFMAGAVTFILDDNTYPNEIFPINFDANPGNNSTNKLTIKPNTGATPLITGSSPSAGILVMNGLDYVTVDGSNSGGTDKSLTMVNTSGNGVSHVFGITSNGGTDPSKNITLKNCILQGSIEFLEADTYVIAFNYNGGLNSGGFDNILITNNTLKRAKNGITVSGSTNNLNNNVTISNNIIGSTDPADYINRIGIDLQHTVNGVISGNDIMGPAQGNNLQAQIGVIYFNSCSNTKITANKIHDFYSYGASSVGIKCNNDNNTAVTEISNNQIYNIQCYGLNPGPAQNNSYGIYVRTGGNIRIWHNTIYLSGPFLNGLDDFAPSSSCIGIHEASVAVGQFDIRNNILRNSMTNPANPQPPTPNRAYAIMITATTAAGAGIFSQLNYNDYYIDGYQGSIAHRYEPNGAGPWTIFPTLDTWQAYTGKEANTITDNPVFVSETDLHPTSLNLNSAGQFVMNKDFSNVTRKNPPDMGAYEWSVLITDYHTLAATNIAQTTATINGDINTNGEVVEVYIEYGLTTSYGGYGIPAGLNQSQPKIRSLNLAPLNAPITGLTPNTTYHFRFIGFPSTSSQPQLFGNDMTFTTLVSAPAVVTTAATAVTSAAATLNGTVNPNAGTATVTIEYGLTTAYGSTVAATPGTVTGTTANAVSASISGLNPYTTYHYRVVATNAGGTTNGNDMTFTTVAVPALVNTLAASDIGESIATLNGSVNANYAPTDVTFEWGLTNAYGNTANATPVQVTGNTLTPVSAQISGLTQSTTYHYRCVGTGPGGTVYGADQIFTSGCFTPALPGTINGSQSVCKNTPGVVYSIDPIATATSYTWTVPTGTTITSGANTNSITVDFSVSAVNGNVTVAANNVCGAGPAAILPVTINELPVPVVSGPVSMCQNTTGNVYTTDAGMTNYVWTVTGGTITAGAGTNSITVTWTATGAQSVNVNYANANGCSAVSPVSFPVEVLTLPVPVISGANVACESSAYLDYTTEAGMTNYVWDLTPNSGTITQTGTNMVTIFWNAAGSKWVSVSYTNANGCTAATPTVYNVTVNPLPATPGAISGQVEVCAGATSVAYSVTSVTGAISYAWTLPTGAVIATGAGTNSITVNYGPTAASGNISVVAQNSCGDGQPSSKGRYRKFAASSSRSY
jgi:trimeric autotransporter adhesin